MWVLVDIPPGVKDGAVVELYKRSDGNVAADVRIPAPQEQP